MGSSFLPLCSSVLLVVLGTYWRMNEGSVYKRKIRLIRLSEHRASAMESGDGRRGRQGKRGKVRQKRGGERRRRP